MLLAFLFIAVLGTSIFFLFSFFVGRTSGAFVYNKDQSTSTPKEEKKPVPVSHIKTPEPLRGIYMTSWVASTPSLRDPLIRFIEDSEINAVVLDIKDSTGKISFLVNDPLIKEMDASEKRIVDLEGFIKVLHEKNIYVIGRISVFQDPYIVKKRPDIAILNKSGAVWKDRKGLSFVDPLNPWYWDYVSRIAKESASRGFDEINFDYIRYPTDGAISEAVFPYTKDKEKQVALEEFFTHLRESTKDIGVPISADLFGLTTWAQDDLGIGQVLERAAPHFDYIAPMTYPSHYGSGFEGFKNPADHPYEVMHVSVERAVERLKAINQDPKKIRPWIQDFDLGREYGAPEVHAQTKAIYDAGLTSWVAWDAANVYTKSAYIK